MGYIAPEYVLNGLYSTKTNVYNFSVLIMEMITGKPNIGGANQNQFHEMTTICATGCTKPQVSVLAHLSSSIGHICTFLCG